MEQDQAAGGKDKAQAQQTVKASETKRFRLRAVSHVAEIYERYFPYSIVRKCSWMQLFLGGFIPLTQLIAIMFMDLSTTQHHDRNETGFLSLSTGTMVSTISISIAALVSLWATKKPSYIKLHMGMAFNIIGAVSLVITFVVLRWSILPSLTESPQATRNHSTSGAPITSSIQIQHPDAATIPYAESVYAKAAILANDIRPNEDPLRRKFKDPENIQKAFTATYILGSLQSIAVLIQIWLSALMAFHCGRAICCGRTHLEGKFLEMEAVNKDNRDSIINIRCSKDYLNHNNGVKKSNPAEDAPPSYPSQLTQETVLPITLSFGDK